MAILPFNFMYADNGNPYDPAPMIATSKSVISICACIDSSASNPIQYYDAELTTLIREWLSIGVGATVISAYGATSYQITPSASLGLCLGPKNWKIQLTQQAGLNSDKKIIGRASLGIALRL